MLVENHHWQQSPYNDYIDRRSHDELNQISYKAHYEPSIND
jgi:hypothetical protein